jgi:predicted nucleic acid-binding protein
MGALILDASVLIGLLDTGDAHHQTAVDDVEAADRSGHVLHAPANAYSEALVAFARAGRGTRCDRKHGHHRQPVDRINRRARRPDPL